MITSQNGKEYDYRNYDGMKKTYVIWILPQAAKKRDGHVNCYKTNEHNISGSTIERLESYDKSEQIMIYLNKDHDIKDKYEDSDWIKTPLVIFLNNTYDLLIKKEVMKDKSRIWTIVAVIVAILLLGYWIFFTKKIDNAVDQQGEEVIEDLEIPAQPDTVTTVFN